MPDTAPAGHDAADALTGQGREVVHVLQGDVVRHGGLGDGPGNGMVGAGRQTGRQRTDGRFIFLPRAKAVGLARLAVGEGAGLVQGQAVEASALFQEHAALDEDAVAGGGRAMPLTMLTGVEMTRAQGQPMTSITSAV